MNFSEIELFEIARLIKEQEKNLLFSLIDTYTFLQEVSQKIEDDLLFYARQEKQKKRQQHICNYIDNEETLAYLKENYADIFELSPEKTSSLSPTELRVQWLETHQKILHFFEELLRSTSDASLSHDIEQILQREKTWHDLLGKTSFS